MPKIIVNNPKNVIEAHLKTNYFKLKNTGGPKGDQGPKGDTGEIAIGSTTTGAPGSNASVTNSGTSTDAILNFTIPRGDKGDKGDTGATGQAATITVGSTTTGQPGTSASVTNSGTSSAAVLNFTIPKGAKGDTGATGTAATVTVGTTTTGAAGTSASVTNSGTSSAAVLNFTIPKGDTGATGAQGPVGSVKSTVVASLPSTGNTDTFYLVDREATTGSGSGSSISFTNPEPDGDITSLQLNGNTTQTTYTGKNLFNFEEFATSKTASGGVMRGTASVSGNAITVTATSNDAYTTYASNFPPEIAVTPNTDMVLSWTSDATASNTGNVYVFGKSGSSTTAIGYSQAHSGQYAFNTGSYSIIKFRLGVATSGKSITYSNIQMEYGSTPTSYEPYTGGVPSPNPSYPQPVNTVTGGQVVTIAGKNLIEDTITGGSIDNSGKIGSNASFKMLSARVQEGQTYTITSSNGFVGGYFTSKPASGSVSYDGQRIVQQSQTSYTVTAPITGWICFRANADDSTPQFELGPTATAYVAPNTTSYEINLGKNLLDASSISTEVSSDVTTTWSDGIGTASGTVSATSFVAGRYTFTNPLPPGTYTISLETAIPNNLAFRLHDGTSWHNYSSNTGKSITMTTDFYAKQMSIGASGLTNGSQVSMTFKHPQFEAGSAATSYAAYVTPTELCKIGTAQDYIWNDEGTWKVHKATNKEVLNGTEPWQGYSSFGNYYRAQHNISDIKIIENNNDFRSFSDHFYVDLDVLGSATIQPGMYNQYRNTNQVYFGAAQTSLSDFKTWLASNQTTLYYELATPTDTAITDANLIAQLDALLDAPLLSGVNNIVLSPNAGALGTLDISYSLYDELNQHKVYIWSSSDQTWQVIVP